jgi:membrane protein required for colicin V production
MRPASAGSAGVTRIRGLGGCARYNDGMNWLDYAMIAVVTFSVVLGFMRGLLREVIALCTWLAAVWLAWQYGPALEPHLGGALAVVGVRPWAARALVFLGVLLVGTTIGVIVAHLVRLSIFSGLDRLFGGVFGLLRGLAMLGVFVILCHALQLNGEIWWRDSILVPYAERAGNVLRGLVGERKIRIDHSVNASL